MTEAAAATQTSASGGVTYDGKIAGLYDLEETLGSGHFAVVKLARHVFTGAKVAVKVVDKTKLDEVSKAHLFQEVRCMKLVQHPNVVRLYEVIDTQTKLYLVLELGDGGDLYDYIMKHEGGLNENLARKYFRQILRAITYCHQLHVVHRDLKPENVVFFEKLGVVKLTDFGFSNKFSPGQKLETFCGSLAYSAPEILLGDSYDAPAVDIWSLGVILYMLVCGQPPFEKANDSETLTMIMDCKYTVPPQISHACQKLIASMLVRDPNKRATLEQIAADPWLTVNAEHDTLEFLPLVSREELTEEDHAFIIQKMINGNIASKEDIQQSLEKDTYNHITATYFLLAEIRLRKRRAEQAQKQFVPRNVSASDATAREQTLIVNKTKPGSVVGDAKVAVPISINVSSPPTFTGEAKPDKRTRKCSIVREEDEDESYESNVEGNELRVAIPRRESISDGRLNQSVQERTNVATPIVVPMHAHNKLVVPIDATLVQKLNQIDKHTMAPAVEEDALRGLKELEICKFKPLSAGNKNVLTHRRTKLNKIRTPSCSSSEASDDDTKVRNKKKINKFVGDTPVRFRMHRRDSHDDSSDSQDQTFPSSGAHSAHAANVIANSNSKVSDKKEGQAQGKEQKTEDTRKSSHPHTQKSKKQHKEHAEKGALRHNKPQLSMLSIQRWRIRESQSLDRITEAQEYELRHQHHHNHRVDSNEEYEETIENSAKNLDQLQHDLQAAKSTLLLKRSKVNIYNLNSIEEIDLLLEDKNITKAIQVTRSRCFVTMKKIRRLGKYFPVVNFS